MVIDSNSESIAHLWRPALLDARLPALSALRSPRLAFFVCYHVVYSKAELIDRAILISSLDNLLGSWAFENTCNCIWARGWPSKSAEAKRMGVVLVRGLGRTISFCSNAKPSSEQTT